VPRRLDAREREQFTHVPVRDLDRARLVRVSVVSPGIAGMTLGRWILLRRGHEHDRDLIAHELVHVRQWRELGAVRFLVRYLGAYARGRWRGLRHHAAYEAIPLEAEARLVSGH
jgi:Domain of unknown function (DUF4157)